MAAAATVVRGVQRGMSHAAERRGDANAMGTNRSTM
jgi:hypothetical protein